MSLGRPVSVDRRKKLIAILAVTAVIMAAAIGYITLRGGGESEPQLAEKLRSLRSTLDLMMIEYSEAVKNGSVKLESEYQVALSLARRASIIYEDLENELVSIDREASMRLGELINEIVMMVEGKEDPELVERKVVEALEIIDSLMDVLS